MTLVNYTWCARRATGACAQTVQSAVTSSGGHVELTSVATEHIPLNTIRIKNIKLACKII